MVKLGRISKIIENQTEGLIKSGDICISDYHIGHISMDHQKELSQLGMDPLGYVKYIVGNFIEIRKGSGISFLLVSPHNSKDKDLRNVAAISMEYVADGEYWEVSTAQPRSVAALGKKKLIWPIKNKVANRS